MLRLTGLFGLFLVFLVGAGAAARESAARFTTWQIGRDLLDWQQQGELRADRELANHIAAATAIADRGMPGSEAAALAARLHNWRAWVQRRDLGHAMRELDEADRRFREALLARPLWAGGWAARAETGARRGGPWSPALNHYLDAALDYGRHDIDTQLQLVAIVYQQWTRLPDPLRQELRLFLAETEANGPRIRNFIRRQASRTGIDPFSDPDPGQ